MPFKSILDEFGNIVGTYEQRMNSAEDSYLLFKFLGMPTLKIRTGANLINWSYELNTSVTPTVGGEVIQILSCFVGPMRIEGMAAGMPTKEDIENQSKLTTPKGWGNPFTPADEMEEIIKWFREYMHLAGTIEEGRTRRVERAIHFLYPRRGWDFYIQVTRLEGFAMNTQTVAVPWAITAEVVSNNGLEFMEATTMNQFTDALVGRDTLYHAISDGYEFYRNPFINPSLEHNVLNGNLIKQMGDNFQDLVAAWVSGDFNHYGYSSVLLTPEQNNYRVDIEGPQFVNKYDVYTDPKYFGGQGAADGLDAGYFLGTGPLNDYGRAPAWAGASGSPPGGSTTYPGDGEDGGADGTFSFCELYRLWIQAGGPESSARVAAAIALAESGGCPFSLAGPVDDRPEKRCTWRQTSGENSAGLWQINRAAHPQFNSLAMYDPLQNARAAVLISSSGTDFTPWSVYNNRSYLSKMSDENCNIDNSPTKCGDDSKCSTKYTATKSSGSRSASQIKLIVIHDTEGGTAESNARYFASGNAGGSTQLIVDDKECFRTLSDLVIPQGAPGANTQGLHIEQVGLASWSKEEWMQHSATIDRAAALTAYWCSKYGIPAVWLGPEDLSAGKSGITSHRNTSTAFGGDHTDPGPNYPTSYFMSKVQECLDGGGSGGTPPPTGCQPGAPNWDCSYSVAKHFADIALKHAPTIWSEKRPTEKTASGGISDHYQGATHSYAYDIHGTEAQMHAGNAAVHQELGIAHRAGSWTEVIRNGYRIQVGWQVPDHYDHIHIGARSNNGAVP